MSVILGIDPSLTATGVAQIDGDERAVESWTIHSKPTGSGIAGRVQRIRRISLDLNTIVAYYDLLVIEAPALSSRSGHQHDRSGLWWRLVMHAVAFGVPVIEVAPQTVKKYATGKGNADKDAVLLAVERRFPGVAANNNEADALILASIGARLMGQPIDDPPKACLAALDKITPQFEAAMGGAR